MIQRLSHPARRETFEATHCIREVLARLTSVEGNYAMEQTEHCVLAMIGSLDEDYPQDGEPDNKELRKAATDTYSELCRVKGAVEARSLDFDEPLIAADAETFERFVEASERFLQQCSAAGGFESECLTRQAGATGERIRDLVFRIEMVVREVEDQRRASTDRHDADAPEAAREMGVAS